MIRENGKSINWVNLKSRKASDRIQNRRLGYSIYLYFKMGIYPEQSCNLQFLFLAL